jgi:ribosomal protein S18 acetylase RimI-like enzyme
MAKVLTPIQAGQIDQPGIEVLALAVGDSSPLRMARVVETYDTEESYSIYLCRRDGTLGLIGFETRGKDDASIRHIAVDPSRQRRGIGRLMITAAVQELGYKTLRAETDADAVGFYSSCGFRVETLGEKHLGVERFECIFHAGR